MKKTLRIVLVALLSAVFALSFAACKDNEDGTTDDEQQETPSVQMTESYAKARQDFQTITGYLLPELENCELLNSSDLRVEQHTVACFDITGTAGDMATINEALQRQVGRAPSRSDALGSGWRIEVTMDGKTFAGDIWTTLDAGIGESGETYSYVYVNYNVAEVAASYLTGRQQFYQVTGVLLPLFAGVEAEDFPYEEGGKSYCFDLTGGDSLAKYVFDDVKKFLDEKLSAWTSEGPKTAGEYTNVDYTGDASWIGITWDETNQAVYVNANMN